MLHIQEILELVDADDYIRDKEAYKLLDMFKNYSLDTLYFDMKRESGYGIINQKLLSIYADNDQKKWEQIFSEIGLSYRVIFIQHFKMQNQQELYGLYHFDQNFYNNTEVFVWIDNFEGKWGE